MSLPKLLRKALITTTLALPVLALGGQQAIASKDNFTVFNDSRTAIRELYVSDSSRSTWENNLLSDALRPGQSTRVAFQDNSANRCLYDIRAVFTDGQVVEEYQVNVCTNDDYTFYSR